jgi:hypothetical protein
VFVLASYLIMIRYLCSSYMDSNCYERIFQCKDVLMLLDAANPAYMCALCFLSRDAIETGVLFGSLNDSAFFSLSNGTLQLLLTGVSEFQVYLT